VREGEAESLVAMDSKEEAGAAKEGSSERRRQWRAVAQPLRLFRRARASEGEWKSANGIGGRGERGRALLVADQGVSTLVHGRHVAARLCRLATAARRSRPSRVDAGAGTSRGKALSWAGPASASGPEARLRPASAPLSLFSNFFFPNIFQAHFDSFKIFFRFGP